MSQSDGQAESSVSPTTPASVAPIRLSRLSKTYGSATVVDEVSVEVAPGRVTGFLGPNGAGKTTTLKMLLGLVRPTSGSAQFGDRIYRRLPRPQRLVGTMLGADAHPGRSGRNHLRILASTAGVPRGRLEEVLRTVSLSEDAGRPVGQYSLGMRQRLALAGALLADPKYLILDEPANGLDPDGIRWLRTLLRDQAAAGKVVLLSSHLLAEVQATVDDLLVIHRGRLLHQGPLTDLSLETAGVLVRVHPDDSDRAAEALAAADLSSEGEGPEFRCSGTLAQVGAALFQGEVEIHELSRAPADLERAFFALLQRADAQQSGGESGGDAGDDQAGNAAGDTR